MTLVITAQAESVFFTLQLMDSISSLPRGDKICEKESNSPSFKGFKIYAAT